MLGVYKLPHIVLVQVIFIFKSVNPTYKSDFPMIFLSTCFVLIFPVCEMTHLSTTDDLQSLSTTYLFSFSSSYIHFKLLIGHILSRNE